MSDCPTCGAPMLWSQDHTENRCSIYGSHPEADHPCQCHTCTAQRERDRRRAPRLRAVS